MNQIELRISAEGRGFSYLLVDRVSGQIVSLSRAAALAWRRFSAAALGDATARETLDTDAAKRGFAALSYLRQVRDDRRFARRRINPIQMQLRVFDDLSTIQPRLRSIAYAAFGVPGLVLLVTLAIAVTVIGTRNNWAILTEFNDVLSVKSLLTFGMVAPFLKILHESGHVLAATRYGVRLRSAGVNLIGLFPMPYVDCSEADLTATRRQRLMISGAGIITDFTVGLVIFLGWHFSAEGPVREVLGRAFVYSVFNSLLFNANPLMRMDGYFMLADILGHRNLGTDASAAMTRMRRRLIVGASAGAAYPLRGDLGLATYGAASLIYRWSVILTLVWTLLPRYLGLGLFVGIWGGWVMLASQLMAAKRSLRSDAASGSGPVAGSVAKGRPSGRRQRLILTFFALGLGGLMFVPIAPVAVVDMAPDASGLYAVTLVRPGRVVALPPIDARVRAGDTILRLENPAITDALRLAELGLDEARLARQVDLAAGAAGAQRGDEQVIAAERRLALAQADSDALVILAPVAGRFSLTRLVRVGDYLPAGAVIAQLLPDSGEAVLVGAFPEIRISDYDRGVSAVALRSAGLYTQLDPSEVRVVEEMRVDGEQTQRSFTLRLTVPRPASDFGTGGQQARLKFTAIPLWRHIAGWVSTKIAQFRDAEIWERQRRLEND